MAELSNDLKGKLNGFYISLLKNSERIAGDVPEKKNLYLDAFFGLIRNGHKYEIQEEKPKAPLITDADTDKKKKKKNEEFFDDDPTMSNEPVRNLVMIIDGVVYKCAEVDLQFAFGSMFNEVTGINAAAERKGNDIHRSRSDDFFLPDVYSGYEEQEKNELAERESATVAATNSKPVAVQEDRATIPYIPFDNDFERDEDDSKDYDTFLFNYHTTSVRYLDGAQEEFEAYIYPLDPDTSDSLACDILIVMTDNQGRVRTGVSEPGESGQKSVEADFDDIKFVIRGSWSGGEFSSSVSVLSTKNGGQPIVDDVFRRIQPTHRTSAFYLRHIAANGNVLNVFPLGLLRNDPQTGLAISVFMFEDGHERKLYFGGEEPYVSIYMDGSYVQASSFWIGNSLNLSIDIVNQ